MFLWNDDIKHDCRNPWSNYVFWNEIRPYRALNLKRSTNDDVRKIIIEKKPFHHQDDRIYHDFI